MSIPNESPANEPDEGVEVNSQVEVNPQREVVPFRSPVPADFSDLVRQSKRMPSIHDMVRAGLPRVWPDPGTGN